MRWLRDLAGVIVEPSGAVGVAAVLESSGRFAGQRIATVLCGGNVSEDQVKEWIP